MRHTFRNLGCLLMIVHGCCLQALTNASGTYLPPRAAFFYGYPSLVNGVNGDIQLAARVFSAYDIIVLGDGVEFPTMVNSRRPIGVGIVEYGRSKQIIAAILKQKPKAEIFGYVCLGDTQALSIASMKRRITMWKALGVSGIFLDEAGYDWPLVTRSRQNLAIRFVHSLGMAAFLNAYHPTTLISLEGGSRKNPTQEASALTSRDLILLESFPIKHGDYVDPTELHTRLQQALSVRQQVSARIVSLSTTHAGLPFSEGQMDFACWTAWMFDMDGIAWGEPDFSADNSLPERTCKFLKLPPAQLQARAGVTISDNLFWRVTADGIVVLDIKNNRVDLRRGQYQPERDQLHSTSIARRFDAVSR
jgi:hypothetical protein